LNVAGHVRLQDAAWVEQFDIHASDDPSASRSLSALWCPPVANAVPINTSRKAIIKVSFIRASLDSSISPNNLHEPVLAGSRVRSHVASGELGECADADTKLTVRMLRIGSAYCLQQVSWQIIQEPPKRCENALVVGDPQLSLAVWLFLKFNTDALAYF
jgi:hypothetical protein